MKLFFQTTLAVFCFSFLFACQPANIPSGSKQFIEANKVDDLTELPKFTYRLGAGDKIRIIVFGEDEMSGEFEVSNNGGVSLPYIREVKAKGLDITTLEKNIEDRYKLEGILRAPKVSVEVLEYRPFYIHGEITEGGEFPYKAGMDIRNAVALAGGYTYRADTDTVYIRREGSPSVFEVNLSSGKTLLIYPGDNIQVPERYF